MVLFIKSQILFHIKSLFYRHLCYLIKKKDSHEKCCEKSYRILIKFERHA